MALIYQLSVNKDFKHRRFECSNMLIMLRLKKYDIGEYFNFKSNVNHLTCIVQRHEESN